MTKSKTKSKKFIPFVSLETSVESALADIELFRAWLNSKGPNEPVGICSEASECGIANYLKSLYGSDADVSVDESSAIVILNGGSAEASVKMPQWGKRFILKFDKLGPNGEAIVVSAKQAKACLPKKKAA